MALQPTSRALAIWTLGLLPAALPSLGLPQLWPLWLASAALVLLACGLDAILCPRTRELLHRLEVPAQLALGDTAHAQLHLALPRQRSVLVRVTLDLSELAQPVSPVEVAVNRSGAVAHLPLTARRRGVVEVIAAWVRYGGPLGLMARTVRVPLGQQVRVLPSLSAVYAAALRFANPRETLVGLKIEHFSGDGSEFVSLREHQPDLDPRGIDWKASARHTQLLNREFRAERNHQVVLALDTGRLMAEPLEGMPRLDHGIHAALLLSYVSLRHGDRVSLFAFDQQPHRWVPPRGGVRTLGALQQLTAELEYSSAETNFTLGLTDLLRRLRRRSLVVVLTDFVDAVTAELMVENVRRLALRHLVVFVALRDPLLAELADAEPATLLDVERAVVADSLIQERELVLHRLQRLGVLCVDVAPRQLGPQLLNRYLEVKRREMI